MLHSNHFGRKRMLGLARSKIRYPGMEKDIEDIVNRPVQCLATTRPKRRYILENNRRSRGKGYT